MSNDNDVISIRTIAIREPREKRQQRSREDAKKYRKSEPSTQDLISRDPEMLADKLQGFEEIRQEHYADIETGTFIRYIKFDRSGKNAQIRLGGYVIKNGAPDYWVLRSGAKGKQITWSVPLKCVPKQSCKANIYYKRAGLPTKSERERYGAEMLEALHSGRYQLIDTADLAALTGDEAPLLPTRRRRIVRKVDDSGDEGVVNADKPLKTLKINFS